MAGPPDESEMTKKPGTPKPDGEVERASPREYASPPCYAHELAGDDKVVARAKKLQDVLGNHQDSVVAEERLRALSSDAPADQALAAGLLIEHERRLLDAQGR